MEHFFVKKEQMAPCFIMKLWMSLWFLLIKFADWLIEAHQLLTVSSSTFLFSTYSIMLWRYTTNFTNFKICETLCPGLFLKRNWRKMNVCLLKGTHLTKKISSRVERRVELNSALETAQGSNLHQIQNGAELLANKWVCWLWRGDKMTCSLLSVLRGGKKRTFSQTQGFFILIRHSHYAASMKVVT